MYSKSTSRRARIRRISLGAIVDVFNFIEQFKALSGCFHLKGCSAVVVLNFIIRCIKQLKCPFIVGK